MRHVRRPRWAEAGSHGLLSEGVAEGMQSGRNDARGIKPVCERSYRVVSSSARPGVCRLCSAE
eukprot:42471-Eustigmatos_ZCMA.PRE.1